jgi:hypothetical protein
MTDRLFLKGPQNLLAITVNGSVIVETEEERQRLVRVLRRLFRNTEVSVLNGSPCVRKNTGTGTVWLASVEG